MATAETKLMTAEEFYDWVNLPDNRDRIFELERGEIVEMSRPRMWHGYVCGNVTRILGNFTFARQKGFICSNDTGVIVERDPDTVRGPDVMLFEGIIPREEIQRMKFAEIPALLSVEVLSPNDRYGEIMRRVQEQLDVGTQLVWVIDPEARNVTVHRPGKRSYVVQENGILTGDDVLPDFQCPVRDFFILPGQPST